MTRTLLIFFKATKTVIVLIAVVATVVGAAIGILWLRSYLPDDVEAASVVCTEDAPELSSRSLIKVMSYNVQYMASKNYVFFYDIDVDNPQHIAAVEKAGKTIASYPSEEHVRWTLDQVAELIEREDPDVVLLQEINGADDSRTHYMDHGAELLARLPVGLYPCQSEAPYWRAEFIFHPNVLGPVDMKLLTLSKYRITKSLRHQLPRKRRSFLTTPFYFQRALLESRIATSGGQDVALINTHFDAWGAGTGIMEQQIARTEQLLRSLDDARVPWVMGGDLNLLPPDDNRQRQRIHAAGTGTYDENPQIKTLYDSYRGIPPVDQLLSDRAAAWYTHFPNDPSATGPDRTIDYLFFSDQWLLDDAYVLHGEALAISDHFPVVGVYTLPSTDTASPLR